MKIKNFIKMLIVTIFIYAILNIILVNYSNAAIQIKAAVEPQRSITMDNAFQYCYDMRFQSSTLGNNTLDPHLSTARDWSAVSYLALSSYGTVRDQTGSFISIDSKNHYTTTGNISGVMNFGRTCFQGGNHYTYVSNRVDGFRKNGATSKLFLDSNAKYVDIPNSSGDNIGMAFGETRGWYSSSSGCSPYTDHTCFYRMGVLGFSNTNDAGSYGNGDAATTYRPVIWN